MTYTISLVCDDYDDSLFPGLYRWSVLIDPPDEATDGTFYTFRRDEESKEWFPESETVTRSFQARRERFPSLMQLCTVENLDFPTFQRTWNSTPRLLTGVVNNQGAVRMALQTLVNRQILPFSTMTCLNNDVPTNVENREVEE